MEDFGLLLHEMWEREPQRQRERKNEMKRKETGKRLEKEPIELDFEERGTKKRKKLKESVIVT